MSRNRTRRRAAAALVFGVALVALTTAAVAETVTVAVVGFDTTGAPDLGSALLSDLVAAALSSRDGIRLVERDALGRALDEQSLGLSGVVDQTTAARVRRLVGAHVVVTGRVSAVANRLLVTARLIAAETGYVDAVAVEARRGDDVHEIARMLAEQIGAVLVQRAPVFGARPPSGDPDTGRDLARPATGVPLPRVRIHVRETVLDVEQDRPVSAIELSRLLLATNMELRQAPAERALDLDAYVGDASAAAVADVDVIIFGTAVGRFALRTGDLVSAKATVKLTAVDARSRRVLAVADAERKGIDVAPEEAAVQAVADATRASGTRLLAELLRAWNRRDR